jgi:hypothetical protein
VDEKKPRLHKRLGYFWPRFGQAAIFAWGVLACLIFGHEPFRPAAFQCFCDFARLHDFPFCPAFIFLPFWKKRV